MSANKMNDSNDLVVYHCILKTGEVTFAVSPSTYIYMMCLNYIVHVPATFLLQYSLKHYQKGVNYG